MHTEHATEALHIKYVQEAKHRVAFIVKPSQETQHVESNCSLNSVFFCQGIIFNSHDELLDEELQATSCTPPSLQQDNQLHCFLLVCGKRLTLSAA